MGYQATVSILVDALSDIAVNPEEFAQGVVTGIRKALSGQKDVVVPVGSHCNPVTVVEGHHADETAVVAIGGNYGTVLTMVHAWSHHTPEFKERLIRQIASELGFELRKKRKTKK